MKSRDVALSAFDPVADAIQVDAAAADELFAVVDLLEEQPPLRRSLSDPSASSEDRQAFRGQAGGRFTVRGHRSGFAPLVQRASHD